jgi:hypothetical protein
VSPRRPSQRWIVAIGFAVAAAYALAATAEELLARNTAVAVTLTFTAVLIAGPLAIVARALLGSRREDGPPPADGRGGTGPGGGDDGDPAWWPEFERALRARVDAEAARERDGVRPPA